jgi:hypothetical protein
MIITIILSFSSYPVQKTQPLFFFSSAFVFTSQNDGNTLIPVGKPNFGIYFSDILPMKTEINGRKILKTKTENDLLTDLAGHGKFKKQNSVSFENEEKNGEYGYGREKEVGEEEEKKEKEKEKEREREGDSDGESEEEEEKEILRIPGKNIENEKFEAMKISVENLKTVNKKVSVAFQRPEFTELASEILRNTFQNLILECLCGEFQLSASFFSEKENVLM